MRHLFKILPLAVFITACTSTFGDLSNNALDYQDAISQSSNSVIGKTILVGGPIIAYNYDQHSTQIEIINAPLNEQDAPANSGNPRQRAIIVIPEYIPAEQLNNVKISALGTITDIADLNKYGNSTVIMLTASKFRIWRSAKPMFDPNNKERYGYTYKFQ